MSSKTYNIDLPEEVMESLNNINDEEATMPQEVVSNETTEQQPEETSQEATENLEVEANDVNTFTIDGESYDLDTIKMWQEDSTNKENWQKSNTEKAQELAKWNKFAEKLESDADFKEHIKDYFFDNQDQIAKLGLDGKMPIIESEESNEPVQVNSELEERLQYLESMEDERLMNHMVDQLDVALTTLENNNKSLLGGDKTDKFLEFVSENAESFTEGEMTNLDKAFKVWSFDAMQEELNHLKKLNDNRTRNDGKIIADSKKGVQETQTPKKYKSFRDITMDDPNVSKYFDN